MDAPPTGTPSPYRPNRRPGGLTLAHTIPAGIKTDTPRGQRPPVPADGIFLTLAVRSRTLGRLGLVLALMATLALPPLPATAEPTMATTPPPLIDHSYMVVGCMGGLALGALSVVFMPVAGMWMGGLGVMMVRAGLGCAYGGLAGAVASAARATVQWSDGEWRAWTGKPAPALAIEHAAGT